MNKRQIERYFRILAGRYPKKSRVILTGAAAGALYGRVRATMDIDFEVDTSDWKGFCDAVQEAGGETGIAAQFAEDIDHWSSITLLDYRRHTYVYGRIGSIEIRLMEPPYWAIGKLSRYLDSDIQDLVNVFKKTETSWKDVASIAGRALRKSHRSTASILFKRQVEGFFAEFGKKVWGGQFDGQEAIELFRKTLQTD